MANVPLHQNAQLQLHPLRAARTVYNRAKVFLGVQIVLTVLLPVAGAFAALSNPSLRAFVALGALVIAILDASVLDRAQKRATRRAATMQEEFDCAVLDLPWDAFAVGQRPDPEDIHEASNKYLGGKEDSSLSNWYPAAASTVPSHYGRLVCQRANLWWDAKLRRRVSAWALGITIVLGVLLAFTGLAGGVTVESLVLGFLAPASPLLLWGIREYHRQRDAAHLSDRLKGEAERLWIGAVGGSCSPTDCEAQSRLFQNGIYERRASSPPIFNWVYALSRDDFENQMNIGAAGLIKQVPSQHYQETTPQ